MSNYELTGLLRFNPMSLSWHCS